MIREAKPSEMTVVSELFRAYENEQDSGICFQGFEEELASLPGKYASPEGAILLYEDEHGEAIGTLALKPAAEAFTCEIKRLYVYPEARSCGKGRLLVESMISLACEKGYRIMKLDTLDTMKSAVSLYTALGFSKINPSENDESKILYFIKNLTNG